MGAAGDVRRKKSDGRYRQVGHGAAGIRLPIGIWPLVGFKM
jgi:hypothetical protein